MGIGRIDNKVVFVENALIGEIVEVKIIKEYKKYMIGDAIKYLKMSDDRRVFECKYYNKCGGCNIGILNYDKQLEFKKNKVKDIFRKYANIKINPDIVGTDEKGYRNKIILHVENSKLGYYEKETNKLIEIDKCIIVSDKINKVIEIIRDKLDISNINKIMIRSTIVDTMVIFYGDIDKNSVISNLDFVSSIYINNNLICGRNKIIEKLGDYKFYISKDSFFQVNSKQAINLYNQVLEYANLDSKDKVLDLYCGTGTIGIYLAKYCKEVLGIEINSSCIIDARANSKLNDINNIDFICDSASVINNLDYQADVVIVDPPRSGLDKIIINTLIRNKINKIVYVSCDPMTLVRDIKELQQIYELKDIKLFDMFACDYHVESVVLLERR